jgi:hypothetical protein
MTVTIPDEGNICLRDSYVNYGGRLDRGMLPTVTRGRVPNSNQNWNSLANRL